MPDWNGLRVELAAQVTHFKDKMVGVEQIAYARAFLRLGAILADRARNSHKDWWPVTPDDLPQTFERLRFVTLYVEFEQRNRGRLFAAKKSSRARP